MSGVIKLISITLIGLMLLLAVASADINRGKKIYIKKLKTSCGISGVKFARMHTQDEWEVLKEAGKFDDEVKMICPGSRLDPRYENDLYDFSYAYAKDSGNVPSY
jgi:hypothetical protein